MMKASVSFTTPMRLRRHFWQLAPLCFSQFCALQSCHASPVLDTHVSLGSSRSAPGGQFGKQDGCFRVSDYSRVGGARASGIATDADSEADALSVSPEDILQYWFKDVDMVTKTFPTAFWFNGGEVVDKEIKDKFGEVLELASTEKLDHWKSTPQGRLALVLVLDQFSRNIFRDTPRSFAQDEAALKVVLDTIKQEWDKQLGPFERSFFYMPLLHSESLEIHEVADRVFQVLAHDELRDEPELHKYLERVLNFERSHHSILKKFGRYPSRNAILGRKSTPEEEEYLASGKRWPATED